MRRTWFLISFRDDILTSIQMGTESIGCLLILCPDFIHSGSAAYRNLSLNELFNHGDNQNCRCNYEEGEGAVQACGSHTEGKNSDRENLGPKRFSEGRTPLDSSALKNDERATLAYNPVIF